MRAMERKLIRDLGHMRGQVIAIMLVMACGVATFLMSLSMLDSLTGTLNRYYEQNRFADVFAGMKRAPLSLSARIAAIPGVAHVQTRVVERVTLNMPTLREPASGQIVSLASGPKEGLNLLHLRAGSYPVSRDRREVLVSEAFAKAHGLSPGDTVEAVMNGRLETLRVSGIALSPEFIYLISPGAIFPDNKRFGVFWMGRDEMAAAFDMEGAFNDLIVRLTPGASTPEVIARIDGLTDRYGGLGAYSRADQMSHKFVANEIRELRGMSMIVPTIFLGVAAFLLNIVISRMVAVQREQIAALKAVGYSRWEIGRHYFMFVMLIAIGAMVLGTIGGVLMGRGMTLAYVEFFSFPHFQYTLRPIVLIASAGVSTLAALVGVLHALRAAMRLPPAEAMRPQPPTSFKPTILERLGVHRLVPSAVRMIIRQLERRPIKTAMSMLGVALATAILVVGSYSEDAINYIMDLQFSRVQRYDVDVAFAEQTDNIALASLRHVEGVVEIEPYRSVAVRFRHGHRHERAGVIGLSRTDGLYHLLDLDGEPVRLPREGLVMSDVLAKMLDLTPGDTVTVEVLQGKRRTVDMPLGGTIQDFAGLSAYMNMEALNRATGEQFSVSGAYLSASAIDEAELYHALREAPRVAAVNVKNATRESFQETFGDLLLLMRGFIVMFATIIAFGVVYNSARISLSERARDLATLRVVGFTRAEISTIQLGELALITVFAIPIGLVMGYGMSWGVAANAPSELFRLPFIIAPSTFGFAATVVMIATIISGLVVRRRLDRLDLVSVLKSRE